MWTVDPIMGVLHPLGHHAMETAMTFVLSKVLWFIVNPGNALLLSLLLGLALLMAGWRRSGRFFTGVAVLGFVLVTVLPVGKLMQVLEDRFPPVAELPGHIDGIVVLGGSVSLEVSEKRGQVAFGGYAERLTTFVTLARRYPDAKLVFTGGSGALTLTDVREADVAKQLMAELGLDVGRVVFERNARNTHDNAVFAKRAADPQPNETWLLITSAFHMPRAVGCFRQAGWDIVPYPVDFTTSGKKGFSLGFHLSGGLNALGDALHEYIGLAAYYLMDRTDTLFPGPRA